MTFISALFLENNAFLQWPGGWIGLAGVFVYGAGLAILAWRLRASKKRWDVREWAIFGGLFIAEFVLTLFIGVRLPPGQALPAPGSLQSPLGPAIMVFAALPWVLASGLLGVFASTGLAVLSGILLALFDSHQVFTVFEYGAMGLLFGAAVNQMYRTRFFRILRHPMAASVGILFIYPGLYISGVLLGLKGEMAEVLDFALTHAGPATISVVITVLTGCIFGEVIAFGLPDLWGRQGKYLPSPGETSLESRSFYVLGPAIFLMVSVLTVVGWRISTRAAQDMLQDRMTSAANIAVENVPLAVEVGQNLILQLASHEEVARLSDIALANWLEDNIQLFPYFQDLIVIGSDSVVVAGVAGDKTLTRQEQAGVALALQGVPFQFYVLDTLTSSAAQLAFIARVTEDSDVSNLASSRVLLGRTGLAENPFAMNIISSLKSVKTFEGEGFLVDEQGLILYHPDPGRVLTLYSGSLGELPINEVLTSPTGRRILVYSQPTNGQPWTVVITVPAQAAQRLALQIAAPLLGLLLLLALILLVVMRVVLQLVTRSLKTLASDANRIASNKDELAKPFYVNGEDEVGQMRRAFEQMRTSLKAYLDEREQTLLMTQIGEERLSAILESTPDPVLVTDGHNRLLLANTVAKQMFGNGTPLDEGTPIEEVISQVEIVEMLRTAEDEVITREVKFPDGRIYLAKATSVMTEDKRRMGQVCVMRDVTRFKELDVLKSDFVSTVSHDLRSPLTLMRGYATMVQMMGQLNDDQIKYLRRIELGVDKMGHMVNNLLDLGRIEAGIISLETVPLLDIIRQIVGALQFQAEQKKITLETRYAEHDGILIEADPALLIQAIHNLVENAIKYTEPGGVVRVSVQVQKKEESVLIKVLDTGLGISQKDQLRLFEKFYRVPNKKTQAQRGSGLGLAIVKSVVEQHRGRIWVQSELEKGSTFFIHLPLKQALDE